MPIPQSILDLLPTSPYGYGGNRPPFNGETPGSTLHNESSINNNPSIPRTPSLLEEGDPSNTADYRNAIGRRYQDNYPH